MDYFSGLVRADNDDTAPHSVATIIGMGNRWLQARDSISLIKPEIMFLVLITVGLGYVRASGSPDSLVPAILAIEATGRHDLGVAWHRNGRVQQLLSRKQNSFARAFRWYG